MALQVALVVNDGDLAAHAHRQPGAYTRPLSSST